MAPHPTRLLICGYIAALALAVAALPTEAGLGRLALAVWLFGPLMVIGLAMLPGVRRAFSADEEPVRLDPLARDRAWVAAEEELRKWDSDLHAEGAALPDLTERPDRKASG